ncbi:MAG TPA: tripartite tricarboxylate transporter TctB family protein [Anaerovoracaceae bacterium]|nr:tripartite tricarboxylate transporter TctB family protein [Anaerovoracaceae bacterium]
MVRKSADFWAGIAVILFAVIFFLDSLNYDYIVGTAPGPGFLPRWISGFMIAAGIIYLIGSIKKPGLAGILSNKEGLKRAGTIFLSVLMFSVLLSYIGFTAASAVMIFLLFRKEIGWKKSLVCSVIMSAALYYLFVVVLRLSFATNMFGF